MRQNYIATLDELLNGDPSKPLIERRHTSWYAATPELSTEYRSADRAEDRMARVEALIAEMDLKLAYLLED
jgi:hypothetical protein